jgi:hypothetical protein
MNVFSIKAQIPGPDGGGVFVFLVAGSVVFEIRWFFKGK